MKTSLMHAVCTIGICGCAAAPPHDSNDNSPRQAINTSSAIDEYKAQALHRQQKQTQQSATDRRIAALEDQLEQLRLSLAILADAQHSPPSKPSSAYAYPYTSGTVAKLGGGESIELRPQAIVFRAASPFAQAQFTPSPGLRHWLLRATASGGTIAIHGRTDATAPDKANRAIAQQRAMAAYQFLLNQGITATRMRSDYLAAGDFYVDNSTPAGQARNRRVEIEVHKVAPEVHREIAAAISGGQHE